MPQRVSWPCRTAAWSTGLALVTVGCLHLHGSAVRDDFDAATIDNERWNVDLPYGNSPASKAEIVAGRLELYRRAILEARESFPRGVDIEAAFRFTTDDDILTIVLRSDLEVTNQFERLGVQVAFQRKNSRLFLVPEPFAPGVLSGAYVVPSLEDIRFRITDDGSLVRIYVGDYRVEKLSSTLPGRRGNRVALYDSISTTGGVSIDFISIQDLQTSVFLDGKLVRESTVQRSKPVFVEFQSHFPGGQVFFTLDGSTPSFVKSRYEGGFLLDQSTTIRAIAYKPDFQESLESAPVVFELLPITRLLDQTPGGGRVDLDPPGGTYVASTTVTLTAVPWAGWEFIRWEGAAGGISTTNQLTVSNDMAFRALFGTRPQWTIVGATPEAGGSITAEPALDPVPFGTALLLEATPNPENYFFGWANALSGSLSPARLVVTNASPRVTALFAQLEAEQVTLTIEVRGPGRIAAAPSRNVFQRDTSVTLAGLPDPGYVLLGWSGALQSGDNPITLLMDDSKRIAASFGVGVSFVPPGRSPPGEPFALTLLGSSNDVHTLESSSNLLTWEGVATLTNETGAVEFLDPRSTNHPRLFYRAHGAAWPPNP